MQGGFLILKIQRNITGYNTCLGTEKRGRGETQNYWVKKYHPILTGLWSQKMKRRFKFLLIVAVFLLAIFHVNQVQATTLTYNLGTVFSGKPLPSGTAPWLRAVFDDNGGIGSVTLTLTANIQSASEFISIVGFNVSPVPSNLSIAGPANNSILENEIKIDGQKGFDIGLYFPTANNVDRFDGNEILTFTITGTGLTANHFNGTNGSGENAHMSAHIQGSQTALSTFVKDTPVPIPGAAWLFGAGLIGLVGIRRRMRA